MQAPTKEGISALILLIIDFRIKIVDSLNQGRYPLTGLSTLAYYLPYAPYFPYQPYFPYTLYLFLLYPYRRFKSFFYEFSE
jgi:hypothetical protein